MTAARSVQTPLPVAVSQIPFVRSPPPGTSPTLFTVKVGAAEPIPAVPATTPIRAASALQPQNRFRKRNPISPSVQTKPARRSQNQNAARIPIA